MGLWDWECALKLTNKLALPEPIVEAIRNSGYNKGESNITATGLIEPARIGALKEKHGEELEEDASSLIYSLQGQSVHTILERAAVALQAQGYIPEQRFYIEVGGWKVGSQIDVFHPQSGLLQDYKVTSVYAVRDGIKEEYAQQMNIQAECLRQNGYKVERLQIVAILRDWSKMEYSRNPDNYPEHQVKVLDVPLIPSKDVLAFIEQRVAAHKAARAGALPLCTPEERWARPDVWAVKKIGAAKATRLCDTQEAATIAAEALGDRYKVEARPGISTRCQFYCPVASKCSQFQELVNKQSKEGK
jgi:hypothetical protein